MCNEIRLQDEVYANTTLSIAATPTGKDISLRCSRINLLQYTQNYGLNVKYNITIDFQNFYLGCNLYMEYKAMCTVSLNFDSQRTTSNIYTPFLIEYLGRFLGKRGHLFRVLRLAMCQLYRPTTRQFLMKLCITPSLINLNV
ncbi:hypothetical protein T11_6091 [Trichinella zimbabwensis]|uniref:Uncharacterized protein n=1 Tax=Trichinella zimbabwensis TaxID=268475 RepID=A0A0V1HSU6_9BILA|nr:hypothetical protein T11_6091 [Trichinella zimbabwensis]